MLRGPAWSGSIQQELIEKLWVAILTCDTSEPETSKVSHIDKENKEEKECDTSDDSEESSSEDESDSDLDLSELTGGLALVDRFDLFSIVKHRQNEQGATESIITQDINPTLSDPSDEVNKLKGSDEELISPSQTVKSSQTKGAEEKIKKSNTDTLKASVSASPHNSPSCRSGATPKVVLKSTAKTASQSRRPRPDTLHLTKTTHPKSKIPQLSPVFPDESSHLRNRKPPGKYVPYKSIKKRNNPDQKSQSVANQRKPSKIPVNPQKPSKPFELRDRAHLLDVPRRRLLSDPRQNREAKVIKSHPVIWRRRAVTPEAARPYPLKRPTSNKESAEKSDARRFTQRQYYRGNSSKWSNQKKEAETNKGKNSTANATKSKGWVTNVNKATREQGMRRPITDEKQVKPRKPVSPVISRFNSEKENASRSLKQRGLSNVCKPPSRSIKPQNTDNVRAPNNQKIQKAKPITHNTKQTNGSSKTVVKKDIENGKDDAIQMETDSKYGVKELEETKANQELHSPEEPEIAASYGNAVETTRLENCLKEAILGVLQGLPEGWILVPEHTAELFCSLTSVVESFPRPNQARARVLAAIVDAHARRPCGKGEIAALNNAHLLLYVGLKLCCLRAGIVETEEEDTEMHKQTLYEEEEKSKAKEADEYEKSTNQGMEKPDENGNLDLMKGEHGETGDTSTYAGQSSSQSNIMRNITLQTHKKQQIISTLKVNGAQKEIVLKILKEIQKCEGSFDRLMMCLLLGSRAPGRGSGWYCETDEEEEKVRDLRFVLDHLKYIHGCRVSEVVSAPLWSCGSSPVVLAALAESPRLVLALLQYGAGGSAANHYLYSKCYTNGVYLAIAYLVRKLESQYKVPSADASPQHPEGGDQPNDGDALRLDTAAQREDNPADGAAKDGIYSGEEKFKRYNLLTLAGHTPTAACLRYLLRAVPRVPIKFLRDQLGGCTRECGREVAYLLPHTCCLQPATLTHLSRAACRQYLRIYDLLPQIIEDLDVPQTLKDYLNLLRD